MKFEFFQMIGLTWILAIISAYPVFTRAESGSITSNMSHLNDNCGVNWAQGIKMIKLTNIGGAKVEFKLISIKRER